MYSVELSVLLHRALQTRMTLLQEKLAIPDWQEDPEGLHQVRVGSRRVRAVLDLVDRGLYPAYDRQTRKLRKLTRALGLPREMDVHESLLEALRPRLGEGSPMAALEHAQERFGSAQRKARAEMLKELDQLSLKHLDQLLEVPNLTNPFAVGDLGTGAWECLTPWMERAFLPMPALLDEEDPEVVSHLVEVINRIRPVDILAIHEMRTLRSGRYTHVDIHMVIPEFYTIERGHELAERFNAAVLKEAHLEGELHTHVDPCMRAHCPRCAVDPCPIRQAPHLGTQTITLDDAVAPGPI